MSRYLKSTLQVLIVFVFMFGAFGAVPARPVEAASVNVVISEVYGGGGGTGAAYTHDFIELFNLGTAPVDLTGWSVQYASSSGTSWNPTPLSGEIPVGGYYLIRESGGSNGAPLPTADATGSINLSGTNGKVALVNSLTPLTGTGNPMPASVVDFVGYGTANVYEGVGSAPAPSITNSTKRTNVCTDTDNNNSEFVASSPVPQNSSSTLTICDANVVRLTTSPKNRVNDVLLNANILLDFSHSVTPSAGWFTLTCTISGVHTTVVTPAGSSATFSLDPEDDFAYAEACTLEITGSMLTPAMTYNPAIRFSTISLGDGEQCGQAYTKINAIQGAGSVSPYAGLKLATEGVVTADLQSTKKGIYIHSLIKDADANPSTSEGMFIYLGDVPHTITVGNRIRINGTVTEYFGLTEITSYSKVINCGVSGETVSPVELSLPFMDGAEADLEEYENMLVHFNQALVINEYYNFDRYGEIILSSKRLETPTNVVAPGAEAISLQAANDLNKITLDDGYSSENRDYLPHPNGGRYCHGDLVTTGSTVGCPTINIFRGGDTVANLTAVVDDEPRGWKFVKTQPATYFAANPRLAAPDLLPGELRISSINTLNYFTTLTTAGKVCGPTSGQDCRGAESTTEFVRQRAKTIQTVIGMASDITGLLELENDRPVETGLARDYAISDIVAGLNATVGAGTYAYIATGAIGTDAIKAGILYKPAKVTPVGTYSLLDRNDNPAFIDVCNRPVLAQTFRDNITQQLFTVAINHLKSKSSACDPTPTDPLTGPNPLDLDLSDGQGASNYTRTQAAMAEVAWLENDPTGQGSQMYLIIGDLNSYAKEDPINALKNGKDGITGTADDTIDLVERFRGIFSYPPSYGYVYGAQAGYLDGALANKRMASYMLDAKEWHINADEPDVLDYNTNFRGADQLALYNPDPYRSSDHDPILISLMLNHDPAPVDDAYTAYQNRVLTVDTPGVLANDTDGNIYDKISVGSITQPINGVVVMLPDGSFTYTPDPDFVGEDTFTYAMQATPGLMGAYANTATVTITVEFKPFDLYLPIIGK